MKYSFKISGMTCASCAATIENAIKKIPNFSDVNVNLATEKLSFSCADTVDVQELKNKVSDLGYKLSEDQLSSAQKKIDDDVIEDDGIIKKCVISLIFMIALIYLSTGHMMEVYIPKIFSPEFNPINYGFIQFLLVLPILYIGREFFIVGFPSLLKGHPNMNSLISIGVTSALILSIITQLIMNSNPDKANDYLNLIYFESAGVIVALVFLGKTLEKFSILKTKSALKKLMELGAKEAIVLLDGKEVSTPVENVKIGDTVIVKPGQKVPLDGIVTFGATSVDESMLTGESIPVEKTIGSKVTGATLNKNGYIQFKVEKIGADTALSQIIKLMEDAQGRKAPIAKLADQISLYFVPVVILISLIAGVSWYLYTRDIYFSASIAITILIIACPCAMGLATPTAIMVGTGVGAQHGILIKGGDSLEIAQKIDTLLLDKTGTITYGKPFVTDIISINNSGNMKEILTIVASLENSSEHPLATAIVERSKELNIELLPVTNFEAILGKGIKGVISGKNVIIGTEKFLSESKIDTTDLKNILETLSSEGKSLVIAAADGVLFAILGISDRIKPSSKEAIRLLKEQGIKIGIISGDNNLTAAAVAKEVQADFFFGEVLPQDKSAKVLELQNKGNIVGMVGDGINDAPALVQADVGIAVGTGTDVAIESAQIVIMSSNLLSIINMLTLSKKTFKNIKENFFWAFIYNIIGIPFAAGIFYIFGGPLLNPLIAGFAMAFSSVSVVMNALRLRLIKFPMKHLDDENIPKSDVSFSNLEIFTRTAKIEVAPLMENTASKTISNPVSATYNVTGMGGEHCKNRLETAMKTLPEVTWVEATPKENRLDIKSSIPISREKIKEIVENSGYTLQPEVENISSEPTPEIYDATYNVTGMGGEHCKNRLETAMKTLPEVIWVQATPKENRLDIKSSTPISKEKIKEIVENSGYTLQSEVENISSKHTSEIYDATYNVTGMSCGHCKNKLETAMKTLPEITWVEATPKENRLDIKSSTPISKEKIKEIIENCGYTLQPEVETVSSEPISATYNVTGMSCGHCKNKLETAMKTLPEVTWVEATPKENRLDVKSSAPISREKIKEIVENSGYTFNS